MDHALKFLRNSYFRLFRFDSFDRHSIIALSPEKFDLYSVLEPMLPSQSEFRIKVDSL